eukprot:CAMPEP_0119008194 /NCGR_PEP_ID=MMETSP1176-20130426/3526_1 /TAXON_ID=265551 /ORGANISM="Synedropsis recta cf, Strain CCMP1620" /LENGTH=213 /DNA_ID=CAMNT_0006960481 /DNA_START=683 /DNA_END=1324 /DNA_ORIENTATION=-
MTLVAKLCEVFVFIYFEMITKAEPQHYYVRICQFQSWIVLRSHIYLAVVIQEEQQLSKSAFTRHQDPDVTAIFIFRVVVASLINAALPVITVCALLSLNTTWLYVASEIPYRLGLPIKMILRFSQFSTAAKNWGWRGALGLLITMCSFGMLVFLSRDQLGEQDTLHRHQALELDGQEGTELAVIVEDGGYSDTNSEASEVEIDNDDGDGNEIL